jgi:hypothetical protein
MDYWSPDEEQALIQMREQGLTARHISKAMGRTRNSVAGKLDRLGMRGRRAIYVVAPVVDYTPVRPASPPRRFSWEQTT